MATIMAITYRSMTALPDPARWTRLLHVPEPDLFGLRIVGVVAEPGEPFHQPLGGRAIAVPHVDVVAGGGRLAVPLPVVLDIDDAGAAVDLLVEMRRLGAGNPLHLADAL